MVLLVLQAQVVVGLVLWAPSQGLGRELVLLVWQDKAAQVIQGRQNQGPDLGRQLLLLLPGSDPQLPQAVQHHQEQRLQQAPHTKPSSHSSSRNKNSSSSNVR
jgi:hypothetical protein